MAENIKDLNESDKALLESVLAKQLHELSPEDIAIIKARRDYLNEPQVQSYPFLQEGYEEQEQPNDSTDGTDTEVNEQTAEETQAPATPDATVNVQEQAPETPVTPETPIIPNAEQAEQAPQQPAGDYSVSENNDIA